MSGNDKTKELELELLCNYFITGHSFLREEVPSGSWVFGTSKIKSMFYDAEPYVDLTNLSMMSARPNQKMLPATVDNTVKKNLKSCVFDKNGKFDYYNVGQKWREMLGDASVLQCFENKTVEDFVCNGDPKRLHEINSTLTEAFSVNPEFVSSLRRRVNEFVNAPKRLMPDLTKALASVDYMQPYIDRSESVSRNYETKKMEESRSYSQELERGR